MNTHMEMIQIESIYAEHIDAPRISSNLNLAAWKVDKFDNIDTLVKYVTEELKKFWMFSNGQSIAATTLPRKEMIKYFWSKRPTSIKISFKDGTKADYPIEYNKGDEHLPNILYKKPI